jgi:sulfide dehydrogenase cytochrome subunit
MSILRKLSFDLVLIVACQQTVADDKPPRPSTLAIAQACGSCHGTSGHGFGSIPSIAGMPEQEFVRKMLEFRSGQRPATVMDRIARGYLEQDFVNLARFFGRN